MAAVPLILRPTIDRAWLDGAAAHDPIAHALALWDLDRFPDRVRFVSVLAGDRTVGYLLIWLGHPAAPIVHWVGGGAATEMLAGALPPRPLVAVVPDAAVAAVDRARGPASAFALELWVAPARPDVPSATEPGVRSLTRADRDRLIEFASAPSDPAVAEYPVLDPDVEAIWGYFEGERLLGVVRVAVRRPGLWLLGGVYVAPAARGRGIGQALSRAVLAEGHRARVAVALYVRSDRPVARAVYARTGFVPKDRCWWLDAGAGLAP